MKVPAELTNVMPKWGITTTLEMAHFLAQCAAETKGFTKYEEDLFYSRPERVLSVFKARIKNLAEAVQYTKSPQKLANKVYANRYGNGPPSSGDGYKFRGSGFVHLTFRDNYLAASMALFGDDRLVKKPDLARQLDIAADIAGWYWKSRNCDGPANRDDLQGVTKAINGWLNGLDIRADWLKHFKKEMGL